MYLSSPSLLFKIYAAFDFISSIVLNSRNDSDKHFASKSAFVVPALVKGRVKCAASPIKTTFSL